jgi:hypothetical protein
MHTLLQHVAAVELNVTPNAFHFQGTNEAINNMVLSDDFSNTNFITWRLVDFVLLVAASLGLDHWRSQRAIISTCTQYILCKFFF